MIPVSIERGWWNISQALFKLSVCIPQDKADKVDIMPGIMHTLVPSLRAQLQIFVIPLFVLLDKPFKANKSADLYPLMIALKKHKQPGYPAIPVPERMYAQKIEVECGEYDKRMNPFFFYTIMP